MRDPYYRHLATSFLALLVASSISDGAALAQTATHCEVYLLKGGIEAWRAAGLPLVQPS